MFGSQALETAIGLSLVFFVIALATSTVVEVISRWMSKRAGDLHDVLMAMVGTLEQAPPPDGSPRPPAKTIYDTAVFRSLISAAGKTWRGRERNPSYVSAKSFADAVVELLMDARQQASLDPHADGSIYAGLPDQLQRRVRAIVEEVGADLTAVKAGLESWFDETMDRMEGAYRRWAAGWLFLVALGVAVVANASAFHVAASLWTDTPVRQAVVESAGRTAATGADGTEIRSVADAVDQLDTLDLPVGWSPELRGEWFLGDPPPEGRDTADMVARALGWLATAVLVMLGAPFWFDLLTRLVSLRSSGLKPPRAADDEASATTTIKLELGAVSQALSREVAPAPQTVTIIREPDAHDGGPIFPEPSVVAEGTTVRVEGAPAGPQLEGVGGPAPAAGPAAPAVVVAPTGSAPPSAPASHRAFQRTEGALIKALYTDAELASTPEPAGTGAVPAGPSAEGATPPAGSADPADDVDVSDVESQ